MLDAYLRSACRCSTSQLVVRKHFAYQEAPYRKGLWASHMRIVINSSPCISYLMRENTATMQTLVIAHAAFGHNHFFKNNYLFKQWTDADGILDYLEFAKNYVAQCEERQGRLASNRPSMRARLDVATGSIDIPARRSSISRRGKRGPASVACHEESAFTIYGARFRPGRQERAVLNVSAAVNCSVCHRKICCIFLKRTAPRLQPWQRELLRIVRHIAQYFYPQSQTKVMNEGTATYVHYRIMNGCMNGDRYPTAISLNS